MLSVWMHHPLLTLFGSVRKPKPISKQAETLSPEPPQANWLPTNQLHCPCQLLK